MNSKNTLTWLVIAVALFAFIFIYHFFERPAAPGPAEMLPALSPAAVTSVQVIPNGASEISISRTNADWIMTQPVFYPAQRAAVEAFLDTLQKLKPALRIGPAELRENHESDSQYGFQPPQISLVIQSADNSWRILVGNKTPPGDQVYVRVAGIEGIFVIDANWLKEIPQSANDWRDTSLATIQNGCDAIILTNGAKIIELHCNPTNHLWQITRPLAARANSDYIANALQQLQTARVSRFITDNPNIDLTAFGLQPADLDLWLEQGSSVAAALHFGKNPTNDSTKIFAKREGWSAIVTTAKQPLMSWYGVVNDFRDPYLFELTSPVAEIETIGPGTNHIILQQQKTNEWKIVGQKFPVDAGLVQSFIQRLAGLRVSEFVNDVVTPADLSKYGLTSPSRQITLRSAVDDTNAIIAQLLFGTARTNEVFVQHAGEGSVYAITPEDFSRLPEKAAWQFRERRIWNFSENDVTQITVRQNGKTRQLNHNGPNNWSLAAGSQGIINPPAVEEVAHELGNMAAEAWVSRGVSDPSIFGLKQGNLSITVTLKNGQSLTVDFGGQIAKYITLASVTLDGERWVFVFSPAPYEYIRNYLAITPDAP
jgi:Domain of unknown function (DUF4340)